MSSSTRLLVLGVVRLFQPVHGYEVRRELVTWRASEWGSVKPGSIYNALKTLTRDGFLEVVGTDQVGGRPERTTYKLTPGGEEEFRNLLREEWWTVRAPTDPLMAAISFLNFITREEAIMALEHRTTQIHGLVRHMELGIQEHDGIESPFHVREMMRLMNARMFAEVAWSEQFIARLRAGEYTTKGDPPWLAASEPRSEAGKRLKRRLARSDASRNEAATRAALAKAQLEPIKRAVETANRKLPAAIVATPRNGTADSKRTGAIKRARPGGAATTRTTTTRTATTRTATKRTATKRASTDVRRG